MSLKTWLVVQVFVVALAGMVFWKFDLFSSTPLPLEKLWMLDARYFIAGLSLLFLVVCHCTSSMFVCGKKEKTEEVGCIYGAVNFFCLWMFVNVLSTLLFHPDRSYVRDARDYAGKEWGFALDTGSFVLTLIFSALVSFVLMLLATASMHSSAEAKKQRERARQFESQLKELE